MHAINIEVTTFCPLHCPQCYCDLQNGKHIPLETAIDKLMEAKDHQVKLVHLSGGETMCYPHIFEIVEFSASLGFTTNIAVSGWRFTQDAYERLIKAGVSGIFISLNGSLKEINCITRDGFEYAIAALDLLKRNHFANTYLNWVMHSNNCSDFRNMLRLAEEYQVSKIVVLSFKPDSAHKLMSFPTGEQIQEIAKTIREYDGPVQIMVESCFSQLLAVVKDTALLGNLNIGPDKGCRAAKYNYSISVDGLYAPCRHLDYCEDYSALDEYLRNSLIVKQIHSLKSHMAEPCISCYYQKNCQPCLAVSSKLYGRIAMDHKECSLWRTKKTNSM